MLGRRFLLLVAVLMGLTALAASVAPRDPTVREDRSERRAPAPSPSPSAQPEATEGDAPPGTRTVTHTVSADAAPRRVTATEGDLVELEVTSSRLANIRLIDEIEPAEPRSSARFHLLAERPGKHPITVLESGRRIGTLEIRAGS
jgi:hypothetical protein